MKKTIMLPIQLGVIVTVTALVIHLTNNPGIIMVVISSLACVSAAIFHGFGID